jgi:putative ABC transport system permease protein
VSIIIKALLSSLIEKKARTALVLFSIAVSAALIFANEAFARTVTQRTYDADSRWSGSADFTIETRQTVGAKEWIDTAKLAPYNDSFEYVYQYIREKALYMPSLEQMHYFNIIGVDINEYNHQNAVALSQGEFQDWSGNKIIIGSTYANIYHFKLNDTIKLELNNAEYEFQVAGISQVKGLFLRELADGGYILVPRKTLARIYTTPTGANLLFMKLKDRSQRESVFDKLTQDFADYAVRYGINDAVIAAETQNFVMPFQVSSVVVIFMCMFIIFTAFNVITLERIPIVGTLRSIGCTRKKINTVLIVESACLGALGGVFGCLLGLLVLQYIKSFYFTGEEAALNSTVLFGAKEILITLSSAVVITTVSAVLPILRLTRTPIKNIILNDFSRKTGKKTLWWVAGVALMAACIIVPPFLPSSSFLGMIIASALAVGALIGLIPLAPFLTGHISRLVGRLPFLSQEMVLGIRNIRDNASLMNNIQLFSAAIAIVVFMASMFNTMGSDLLLSFNRDTKYDIQLTLRHSDQNTLAAINKIDGVKASAGAYMTHTELVNYQTFINALVGIDNADFFNFYQVKDVDNNREAFARLNDGKNIITTVVLQGKLGLKKGDTMLIQFGSKQVPYTITGFVDTNWGIGHAGFISSENYRNDMGVSDYDIIYIKAKDGPAKNPAEATRLEDRLRNNILRSLGKEVMMIQTKTEWNASIADKVISMFKAINSYCYLALLVGIIGIVNNLVVSFIERKRSFAMYRCIGMSKKGLNRMLVTEAVAMGILGVGYGLLCALVMSVAIPVAVSALWGKVTTALAVNEMIIISAVGIIAMLAISAVPVVRSEKMSLIETIKYE